MSVTDLKFMEGGDKVTPSECVRRYEEVGHETIVRELTQNALDAAREAKRNCDLKFEIRTIPTCDIPGIDTYRDHLDEECMQDWSKRGQSKYSLTLDRLRNLSKRPETDCLMVFDNGIGLDVDTMEGLIGKGDTMKSEEDGSSGGTHGVGHETAFAVGDMNYVMYGGVNRKNGKSKRVASGHVLFPTHVRDSKRYGGAGYLSRDVLQLTLSGVEIIDNEDDIPQLIYRQLDTITDRFETGSVVIVPAFNRFPEQVGTATSNCCELICEDIAKHFFVAIAQNRLNVTVQDYTKEGEGKVFDLKCAADIESRLEQDHIRNEKRRRSSNQLVAGSRIYEAWCTYKNHVRQSLETSFGSVTALIRYTPSQTSRVCIMRSGMFITDETGLLPRRHFAGRKAFSAVLLFADDIASPTQADNILRAAEDAGHSKINDSIRDGKGRNIRLLFSEIKEQLNKVLEKVEENPKYVPDIIPIPISGESSSVSPKLVIRPSSQQGKSKGRRDGGGSGRNGKGKGNGSNGSSDGGNRRRRFRPRLPVRISLVQVNTERYEVEVTTSPDAKPSKNLVLYLETKTGSDDTCEAPLRSEQVELDFKQSRINDEPVSDSARPGVDLGILSPGSCLRLSLRAIGTQWANVSLEPVLYEGLKT